MRIAFFGQAPFARDILVRLLEEGHEIAAVYAPPAGARPDPLAEEAETRGLPLLRHRRFRRKGVAIPELVEEHAKLGAELNVLAYVTVILPPEIVDAPPRRSLCFHPSLLPRFRGGNAIPWQIIQGETETGVSVFQPDAGVDTGPIVVQKGGVAIDPTDTAASLYYQKLYPLGVEAVCEAVARIADGSAELRVQDESQASFQGLVDAASAAIDWSRPGAEIDRLVRGCDPQPGAHARWQGRSIHLFGASWRPGPVDGLPGSVLEATDAGIEIAAAGGRLVVAKLRVGDGPKSPAAEAGPRPGTASRTAVADPKGTNAAAGVTCLRRFSA